MRNFIPKQYHFSHQYCFFLHDLLADVVVSGEKARIFNVSIKLRNKSDAEEMSKRSGEELATWLEDNGYKDIVYLLTYKQICVALLSDLCHFVYEALECSQKGKLTVTYALLRKPFKENLFYLEWLLADPADFLRRFHFNSIKDLSVSGSRSVSPERKIAIIRKAMDKTKKKHWINPEFIYQLRYDKSVEFGLEKLWQRANHLITTFKFLETEDKNFNFVFSDDATRQSQWDYLYSFFPILLFHTMEIVEALIATFAKRKNEEYDITQLRTSIGLLLWIEDGPWKLSLSSARENIAKSMDEAELRCPECEVQIAYDKANLKLLYEEGALECRKCNQRVDLVFREN